MIHPNSAAVSTLLEIRGLSKRYGSFRALDNVSFEMKEGEIISVLGPSGCGKSTLLQLVAGLTSPDDGEIRLKGETIASSKAMIPPEKRNVNMVFQDYALWPHMNVFDNVAYGLTRMSRAEKHTRVQELLQLLHLENLERRLPPQLSGGQQQRVAIARALATRPKLLLLDEPLSNLDMRLRIEMRTEMGYLFRQMGMSVFHVTHDPEEAYAMADRLLIMRNGVIDQIGTPEECFTRPATPWVASLLGAINRMPGQLERVEGDTAVIRIGGRRVKGLAATDLAGLPEGAAVELLFRPEQLQTAAGVTDTDTEEKLFLDGINSSYEPVNHLPIRIQHCTFEGTHCRLMALTEEGHALYALSSDPLAVDRRLTAVLPISAAFVYAADHSQERKGATT